MSASKAKGSRWEAAIVTYLRENGWPHAERLIAGAAHDRGDIAGIIGVVIEAKNQARHSLAEWLDEARTEAANARANLGVVWAHRRGHASAASGYVVMDGETFVALLHEAGYAMWQPVPVSDLSCLSCGGTVVSGGHECEEPCS